MDAFPCSQFKYDFRYYPCQWHSPVQQPTHYTPARARRVGQIVWQMLLLIVLVSNVIYC
jgi:hypothetical protein